MKSILVGFLFLTFAFSACVFAEAAVPAKPAENASIVDVNNQVCPVMGGPVSGKDFVVYEGKRYGLCCPGCAEEFNKNPEKYIVKIQS